MNAPGPDVAVGARQRAAVEVAGAAGQRERAVDDAGGGLVDERLGRLGLGEQRVELAVGAVDAGLAAWCSSISARRAQDAARGGEVDGVLGDQHARPCVAVDPLGDRARASASADSAMPSDADAWNSPAARLRSMYGPRRPPRKPPRTPLARKLDAVEA